MDWGREVGWVGGSCLKRERNRKGGDASGVYDRLRVSEEGELSYTFPLICNTLDCSVYICSSFMVDWKPSCLEIATRVRALPFFLASQPRPLSVGSQRFFEPASI